MSKRLIAVVMVVASAIWGCGGDRGRQAPEEATISWYGSLELAAEGAEEGGDLMLLSFEADWCPWSTMARDSLYVAKAVMESLAAMRCVRVDADLDTALVREFGVVVYPTMVMTDAYGCELGRIVGYHDPAEFLDRIGRIGDRQDLLAEMFRQEELLVDDPVFLVSFGKLLADIGMYDGALIRFDRASQIDSDDRYATLEEATYSMAECYMLSGEYKEAGRRFRIFAGSYPESPRAEYALVLAGLCYQRVDYKRVAAQIYDEYLDAFGDTRFAEFVRSRLDSLNGGS